MPERSPERSLDGMASQFHDRLQSIKNRTALEGAGWYPWRSLAAMQILDRDLGVNLDALEKMIGRDLSAWKSPRANRSRIVASAAAAQGK